VAQVIQATVLYFRLNQSTDQSIQFSFIPSLRSLHSANLNSEPGSFSDRWQLLVFDRPITLINDHGAYSVHKRFVNKGVGATPHTRVSPLNPVQILRRIAVAGIAGICADIRRIYCDQNKWNEPGASRYSD
jgi:hypothetical protein